MILPYRKLLLLILLVASLSSCFELREELTIQADGSGTFKLVADFSEHQQMLKELSEKADTAHFPFGNQKTPDLASILGFGSENFAKINGIQNTKSVSDTVNYIFGFQFDFTDINALNLALVMRDGGEFNQDFQLPYRYEGKGKLLKNDVFVFKKLFKYLLEEEKDLPEYLQSQKKAIFARISYKCLIKTSGKIKKNSNADYEFLGGKKQLTYSGYLHEIYDGIANIGTELKFK